MGKILRFSVFCAASALMLYCGRLNSGRLRLRIFQDRNIGIRVLPQRQEILIGSSTTLG